LSRVPPLFYGTAWKEERTEPLVRAALRAGFRGIDTANQRKHYHEAGVGAAVREALATGLVRRDELFLQTKFTFARGQDHRLPYDPGAPVATQVEQSFASSLEHLGVESLDAYVLHGPSTYPGLAEADREAWGAMEALQRSGSARLLGVSNVTVEQLAEICDGSSVEPAIVQNRTFTRPEADLAVRTFCRERDIAYQGFSLLTAVPQLLSHPTIRAIAARTGLTAAAAVLRCCVEQGMVVLTGTTSPEHMEQDLAALDARLTEEESEAFARIVPSPAREA
jgi:diketogulonate reductase-like aldo/keto reductase